MPARVRFGGSGFRRLRGLVGLSASGRAFEGRSRGAGGAGATLGGAAGPARGGMTTVGEGGGRSLPRWRRAIALRKAAARAVRGLVAHTIATANFLRGRGGAPTEQAARIGRIGGKEASVIETEHQIARRGFKYSIRARWYLHASLGRICVSWQ